MGAAQTGLQVAARLQQNGFRTLVIEQTSRVGDIWRGRYPTLTLHTQRAHHTCEYKIYPALEHILYIYSLVPTFSF